MAAVSSARLPASTALGAAGTIPAGWNPTSPRARGGWASKCTTVMAWSPPVGWPGGCTKGSAPPSGRGERHLAGRLPIPFAASHPPPIGRRFPRTLGRGVEHLEDARGRPTVRRVVRPNDGRSFCDVDLRTTDVIPVLFEVWVVHRQPPTGPRAGYRRPILRSPASPRRSVRPAPAVV
jgi:hypothetical protein